jgi:S1-C subfamily serine protease
MRTPGNLLRTPFASALAGGLVVALAGLIAIEAGWIEAESDSGSIAQPPLTRPASSDAANTVGEIYRRTNDGVVFVRAQRSQQASSPFNPFPQEQQSTATGSGFVIDDEGRILTNAHVVDGAERIDVLIGDAEEPVEAELVGADASSDVALLDVEADADSLTALPMGEPKSVQVGDPVVAIGNPFGLDRTVTSGIVSALQREIQAPNGFSISNVIQTDAAVNPGNSGGPLLDGQGRVIGINSQIATSGGGSEGVGFAVPIDTAEEVVDQLLEGGTVKRAYLGINGADVTPEIASTLDLPVEEGAMVGDALEGGPAAEAGLRDATGEATIAGQTFPVGGDIIVAIDGEKVTEMQDVIRMVDAYEPGDEITLTVVRDGDTREIEVKLGNRPANIQDAASPTEP